MSVHESGRRVLVVEDNPDLQEMVAMCLEDWGHRVICESDGERGLSRALELLPDVGLVDIGLPGIDGYELARRLRNHDRGQRMLLVAMTGYGAPEQRALALDAGFDLVLTKPVDPQRLRDLLATLPDELRVH
jgi:CheY-like chemotaxis protein